MFYLKITKKLKNMITKNDFAVLNLEVKPTTWM
jgi:hypothetical protein